jgi:plastocyanin
MKRALALAIATALVIGAQVLPSAAASRSVTVGDNFFRPTSVTVAKGTTVTWRWKGANPHNVTVTSAPRGVAKFHSTTKTSGNYSRTLRRAGTYRFICTVHGFKMKIVVR